LAQWVGLVFSGFYKCDYRAGDVVGRSVMYCNDGRMLGGNTAFAHVGTYQETDGGIDALIRGQRHQAGTQFRTLYGDDDGAIRVRGIHDGKQYRFDGGDAQGGQGPAFSSVMTRLDEEEFPELGDACDGSVVNGLYSIHLQTLDGIDGGLTGVMLLFDGRILGGDAYFYYLGGYSSAAGRWKGQILNQEHTPARGSIFAGYEVGIGFSGRCNDSGAEFEATALAGKRSLRLKAVLTLLQKA
jgi:hypothetical protein